MLWDGRRAVARGLLEGMVEQNLLNERTSIGVPLLVDEDSHEAKQIDTLLLNGIEQRVKFVVGHWPYQLPTTDRGY